jgi:membrane protease YdiL (CAAX protease family)
MLKHVAKRERRMMVGVAMLYLGAITTNELLTTYVEPRWGLVLHGTLLLIMLVHTAYVWEQPLRDLLLSLSFAPLIRMVSLSLPLTNFPLVYWYFLTSIPLFASVGIAMRTLRYEPRDLGLTARGWPLQVLMGAMGLAFGVTEYRILAPKALAASFTLRDLWVPTLILMVSTGFAEEIIFRGLMQRAADDSLGSFSVAYVSLLFAVLHIGYKSLLDVLFVFAVAVIFGYITEKTHSILGVSLAHGVTNVVLFLVAPFLF